MLRKVRIKKIAKVHSGATPDTKTREYWDGNIPWITPLDLSVLSSRYIDRGVRSITESGFKNSSTSKFPTNSVIISSRAPIGLLAIPTLLETTINQGCKAIECTKDINNLWLFYYLSTQINYLNRLGGGTTFKEISKNDLEELEILVPSIKVQNNIVDIIGTIDEKIECNEKYITVLKNKSKLIYGSDCSEIVSINKLVSIQTGKEDANFAVPNGSYKFFTCAEQSSLCEDYKYEGKNILLAGNGTFNVNHYCGKFNAYQRTYIIKPFNEYDYGLLYFGIKSYVGNLVSSSTGSIVKFIGIDDVKNIKVKKLSPHMKLVLLSNLNRIDVLLDEIETLSQMKKTLLPLLLNEQVAIL
ncbi:MAG: restriction endonuclease subunit S [Acholeplasmataceae bacterium]|nr:restriction endonuclease subunit S [Acholeplasmataceae bacterium]